jgi:hypothetical protein
MKIIQSCAILLLASSSIALTVPGDKRYTFPEFNDVENDLKTVQSLRTFMYNYLDIIMAHMNQYYNKGKYYKLQYCFFSHHTNHIGHNTNFEEGDPNPLSDDTKDILLKLYDKMKCAENGDPFLGAYCDFLEEYLSHVIKPECFKNGVSVADYFAAHSEKKHIEKGKDCDTYGTHVGCMSRVECATALSKMIFHKNFETM